MESNTTLEIILLLLILIPFLASIYAVYISRVRKDLDIALKEIDKDRDAIVKIDEDTLARWEKDGVSYIELKDAIQKLTGRIEIT